jgi:hypothetical protein
MAMKKLIVVYYIVYNHMKIYPYEGEEVSSETRLGALPPGTLLKVREPFCVCRTSYNNLTEVYIRDIQRPERSETRGVWGIIPPGTPDLC